MLGKTLLKNTIKQVRPQLHVSNCRSEFLFFKKVIQTIYPAEVASREGLYGYLRTDFNSTRPRCHSSIFQGQDGVVVGMSHDDGGGEAWRGGGGTQILSIY